VPVIFEEDWIRPRLGVRFAVTENGLDLYHPNGEPFLSFLELEQQARSAQEWADAEQQRAEQAEARARALEECLRQMGIEPDISP
jgi:hypothetical protein